VKLLTSVVTVLRAIVERMRRNRRKLHECNRMGHLSPSATCTEEHPLDTHLQGHGYEGYVTTHVTIRSAPQLEPIGFLALSRECREFFPPEV